MAFKATIEFKGMAAVMVDGTKALKGHVDKATDAGLIAAVKLWRRRYLAGHFRRAAIARYGYKERTKGYERRKAKRFRHTRPLVFTGESEKQILGNQDPVILRKRGGSRALARAGTRGAEFRIRAPKHFFQYKPGVSPDKVDELTRLIAIEIAELQKQFRQTFEQDIIKRTRGRRKVRKVA